MSETTEPELPPGQWEVYQQVSGQWRNMTIRVVEGITIEADGDGGCCLRGPSGDRLLWLSDRQLARHGIPVPPPPCECPIEGLDLTEEQCDVAVFAHRDNLPTIVAAVGKALLAAGYVPRAER